MHSHSKTPYSIPHQDLEILCLGPSLDTSNIVPTVFYFSLSAKDSLLVDPYNQPVVELLKTGTTRVISITLPFHGEMLPEEALRVWVKEIEQGNDPLTPFIQRVVELINVLKENGTIHEDHVALMGLSRGGWIACQIAAQTKIKALVGFAPLTRFSKSTHFAPIKEHSKQFDLDFVTEQLVGIPLHFWISNRDTRVGTKDCIEFLENLIEKSWDAGIRSPQISLQLVPPIGAQGHGTSKESFIAGALWTQKQINP